MAQSDIDFHKERSLHYKRLRDKAKTGELYYHFDKEMKYHFRRFVEESQKERHRARINKN